MVDDSIDVGTVLMFTYRAEEDCVTKCWLTLEQKGSMIDTIKLAREAGFEDVFIFNPNENYWVKGKGVVGIFFVSQRCSRFKLIFSSPSPLTE